MVINTLSIAIFPVCFFGALHLNNQLGSHLKIAKEISIDKKENHSQKIPIKVSEKSEAFNIDQFLFAEAMQNYVAIYILKEGQLDKSVHRITLTNLAEKLKKHNIIRCHRSYIVNPQKIQSISGNAQGLKLEIENTTKVIPVSRKYIPVIKAI